ncbi:winged helix DNA-binding domain-containing protein [Nonomuraea sp. NPDC059194]|uniref:winged helix DNA-binding domain-containing protein n=1 Tax=Nonomuraea sp. NPDC059194 TaxID=3346764 RepID=UPI0036880A50
MKLTRRTLNRTALDRQLLLRRAQLSPIEAIRRLVAVQGQEIDAPYFGLWTRLASFTQDDLSSLLYGRHVVRGSLLRGTQHLTAADDYLWLRPITQICLTRSRQAAFGKATNGVDLDELAALAREHLAGRTLTRPQLRDLLAARWPEVEPLALGWSAQALLPLVHTPPNGIWGNGGATPFTLAEEWIGAPLSTELDVETMIERYLAAFGPASAKDIQMWSGLTRLREVVERMPLRRYTDEAGRDLYDLPDAELTPEDTPAPVRFLPYFDNLVLAYDDRTRMMADEHRKQVCVGAVTNPVVLVDGYVAGMWWLTGAGLEIRPFRELPGEVMEEAHRMLAFAGRPDAEIRITA